REDRLRDPGRAPRHAGRGGRRGRLPRLRGGFLHHRHQPLGERRAAHVRLRARGFRAVPRRKPRWMAPRARSRLARIFDPPEGAFVLDLIVFLAVAALLAVPLVTVHRASTMPAAGPAPRPRPREATT